MAASWFHDARLATATAVGFLILLLLAVVGFDAWRTYRHDLDEANNTLHSVSRLLGEHTARTFGEISLVLTGIQDLLAAAPNLMPGDPRVMAYLDRRVRLLPQVAAIRVADRSGRIVHSSDPADRPGQDLADRAYFTLLRDAADGRLVVGLPAVGDRRESGHFPVGRRLTDASGASAASPLPWSSRPISPTSTARSSSAAGFR
jgi:hypothetical protein